MNDPIQLIKERHFDPCLEMLIQAIAVCPDELWVKTDHGHSIWQIVYHTLAGTWVWLRPVGTEFREPGLGEKIAELKEKPREALSKEQTLAFARETMERSNAFFAAVDGKVTGPFWCKITNLDIILSQIRHIQHHIGYINKILSVHGVTVPWNEYRG